MRRKLFATLLILGISLLSAVSIMASQKNNVGIKTGIPEKISMNSRFGTAESVTGEFKIPAGGSFAEKAEAFIGSRPELFKMNNPAKELNLIFEKTDDLGLTHTRFQQVYKDIPVWGCQTIVHFRNDVTVYNVGGQTIPTPSLNVSPSVDKIQAQDIALEAIKDVIDPNFQTETETELVIYPDNATPHLAQLVTVTGPGLRYRVFVDAQTGNVLHKYNDIHFDGPDIGTGLDTRDSVRTLNIYLSGSTYELRDVTHNAEIVTYKNYYYGGPVSSDPDGDKVWDDNTDMKAEVAGHYYIQKTYEYFLNTFGRDSYDDNGSTILVNVHDPLYVNNAYWNGQGVNFADGDGTNYLPFSGSLDVVAHELAHGVTEYTAGLIYQFQSGALNESMSDVFGSNVDRDDWYLGEEIGLNGNYIRSMENPTLKNQPMHMNDYYFYDIDTDNGGVHRNSGIPNHAYYQAATMLGRDKAEQIWYRCLTTYLTPSSDFYFWAGMTIQSTIDLYGAGSAEQDSVEHALAIVGLGTAYATPNNIVTGALIGELATDNIWIHNPGTSTGSQTVTVVAPSIPGLTVSEGPMYQENIPDGDSSQFVVSYDGSMTDECNLGSFADTLVFEVTGAYGTNYIRMPMTITVGLTTRNLESQTAGSSCLTTNTYNTTAMDYFSRSGNDVMYQGSLMIGTYDNGAHKTYRDFFGVRSFSSVDTIKNDDVDASYRISSDNGKFQGMVTYSHDNNDPGNCDFIIVDYNLFNPCDTALYFLAGLVADLDIDNAGSNRVNYDVSRNMIYMYNDTDTRAAGMALLSGTARNLRGLSNPGVIWDGNFTDQSAYNQMLFTSNASGTNADDWSVLLTFDYNQLAVGDTLTYTVALLYSETGSAELADIYDRASAFYATGGYTCGDVNGDDNTNILDITYMIDYLYNEGTPPVVLDAADVNGDGTVNILDITYYIAFLYQGGAPLGCN